jgi:hypothetical protein
MLMWVRPLPVMLPLVVLLLRVPHLSFLLPALVLAPSLLPPVPFVLLGVLALPRVRLLTLMLLRVLTLPRLRLPTLVLLRVLTLPRLRLLVLTLPPRRLRR